MTRYDAVVFDAGGTLIGLETPDFFEQFFVIAARELGYETTLDAVKEAVTRVTGGRKWSVSGGRMRSPEETRRFWVELYESVLHGVGITGDIRSEVERFYDRFQDGDFAEVYRDVRPALDGLARTGVRLGILSNWSEHLDGLLRRLGIRDYFEFVIISAVVGYEKPDPRIFDLTVDRAGVPRTRLLYIGDHPEEDVAAARHAGIDALLIDRFDQHAGSSLPSIRSLAEVERYVVSPL